MFDIASTLGTQLTDQTRRAFEYGKKQTPEGGRAIFNSNPTNKYTQVFNSAVVDQPASRTADGGVFYLVSPVAGDSLTLTQYKVTISMEVTEMEMFFDQYSITPRLLSMSQGIGTGLTQAIELDTQMLIKNGGSASYTDRDGNTISCLAADGENIFANAHTINGGSGTYDNLDATAFGQTGLEIHLELFRKFLNHDGQRQNKTPTAIYSTKKASLLRLINEYAVSMGQPETTLLGNNTYQGRFRHIALEYLDTDTSGANDAATDDYWGLCIPHGENMKLEISKAPELMAPEKVLNTNNWLIKGQAWYTVGVYEPTDITLAQA